MLTISGQLNPIEMRLREVQLSPAVPALLLCDKNLALGINDPVESEKPGGDRKKTPTDFFPHLFSFLLLASK